TPGGRRRLQRPRKARGRHRRALVHAPHARVRAAARRPRLSGGIAAAVAGAVPVPAPGDPHQDARAHGAAQCARTGGRLRRALDLVGGLGIPAAPRAERVAFVPRSPARRHPRLVGLAAPRRPGARLADDAPFARRGVSPPLGSRGAPRRRRRHRRARQASELVLPRHRPAPRRDAHVPERLPRHRGRRAAPARADGLGSRGSAPLSRQDAVDPGGTPAGVRGTLREPRLSRLLQGALRALYGRYVPEPVKNSLRLQLTLLRRDVEPARAAPPTGRIVVLAPHMDDEVFGCGGTTALAADAGARVTFVYVTDGSKGYPGARLAGPSDAEAAAAEVDLVARRKDEAHHAAAVLGVRGAQAPGHAEVPEPAGGVRLPARDARPQHVPLAAPRPRPRAGRSLPCRRAGRVPPPVRADRDRPASRRRLGKWGARHGPQTPPARSRPGNPCPP